MLKLIPLFLLGLTIANLIVVASEPVPESSETWDFVVGEDKYEDSAALDLRVLNEKVAGEHGFVKLSPDGNSFLRGDGEPLRFWAAGERTNDAKLPELKRQARYLAKRGVNALRIFAMLPPTGPNSQITDVNERELDCVFRTVAAMKSAGIYTIVDGYWAGSSAIQKDWGVMRCGKANLEDMVYIDPKVQTGYKAWMKALLTRKNPYTDIPLAEDPAVAIIQLQNEDSLLWWGIGGLKDDALLSLRQKFADFLKKKYGSSEKAPDSWKTCAGTTPPDEFAKGLPGFLHIWDLTRDGAAQKGSAPGFGARTADQLEFLATIMKQFNSEMTTYLRKELGCKQLINANNWRTVDLVTTQDAEYWADSTDDVTARNIYVGGAHDGPNNGWMIAAGHLYSDKSLLLDPRNLPTNVRMVEGHPYILSEVLWCPPNLYQSEAALVMAGQQSLTGLGAACWFCNYASEWERGSATKWTYSTPMQIGQFPAAALIYRNGYVKAGEPAVVEHRSLQDMWDRKTPLFSEEPGWDPNRDQGNRPPASSIKTALDPLACLVGPCRVKFDSDPSKSTAVDLSKYIDHEKKTVRSITGEIDLNYGVGIYRIDAPKAQLAVGFLAAAGVQKLSGIEIDCKNKYGAVAVVSLDGKPLKESAKVLVQIGSTARPTGWATVPAKIKHGNETIDGFRITSTGKMPWQVRSAVGTLSINNARLTKGTVLDPNGLATDAPVQLQPGDGKVTLTLPSNALYVILSAPN